MSPFGGILALADRREPTVNFAVTTGTLMGVTRPSLDISVSAPPWLLGGALVCLQEQADLFFPDDYSLRHKDQIEAARKLCLSCPSRGNCLEWALPQTSLQGIWAATTPMERRRIRTKKNPRPF